MILRLGIITMDMSAWVKKVENNSMFLTWP